MPTDSTYHQSSLDSTIVWPGLASDRSGAREQTAVDGIYNRRRVDHPSAKISAVETLNGVLAALDLVELEINVALGVGIHRDVDDVTVLGLGLLPDVVLEFLYPVLTLLPEVVLVKF